MTTSLTTCDHILTEEVSRYQNRMACLGPFSADWCLPGFNSPDPGDLLLRSKLSEVGGVRLGSASA